jgi:hypothetical protein
LNIAKEDERMEEKGFIKNEAGDGNNRDWCCLFRRLPIALGIAGLAE